MTPPPARIGAALLGLGALGLGTVQAAPDGWSLSATVSEEIRLVTNPDLEADDPEDPALRATTRLSATLGRESRTAALSLTGGLTPVLAEDMPDNALGILAPSLGGRFLVEGKRTSLTARFDGRLTPTAFTDQLFGLDEEGQPDPTSTTLVTGTAIQASLSGRVGVEWMATRRDTFSLAGEARRVDFFDGITTLVPITSLRMEGDWRRALTPRLDATFSAGLGWFEAESPENPRSVSGDVSAGFAYAVNERLDVSGGLGLSVTRTRERDLTLPGDPRRSDVETGITGDLGLRYAAEDLTVALTLSQGVQPSTLGSLENTTSVGLRVVQRINRVSSLGLDGRVQFQTAVSSAAGTDDQTLALRIGPYYTRQLDRHTELRLGYNFDLSDERGTGTAVSHGVFVTVSRGFDLLK
jgi:hypothetical protein